MIETDWLEALLSTPDRQAWLDTNREYLQIGTVRAMKEQADRLERDDARQSLAIGMAAEEVARRLDNREALALAYWTQANAYDFLAEHQTAVRSYERAAELFNAAGLPLEAARTSIGELSVLMKLGQFERAQTLAETALPIFAAQEDLLSQAKVEMNLGTIYYQRGQYKQALAAFQRAAQAFETLGEPLYASMNQINQASAHTMLDDFLAAEQLHQQARPVFEAAGLRTAAASVEHDLAFLQSARGDYAEALRTFERARASFASLDSQANIALTDLEESDLYLDLNLPDEALRLAERAERVCRPMEMTFELARARLNHAVSLARLGQRQPAAGLLAEARKLFAAQNNAAWQTHADLQRAEVLGQGENRETARMLAMEAARSYEQLGMRTKQAYAHIVAANVWADDGQWGCSQSELASARSALAGLAIPWLEQRIETCAGRVAEGLGQVEQAVGFYQAAAGKIEQMAAAITAEEQRTAFVADKLAPYEALVSLQAASAPEIAFQWAERAKSRALVDLLAGGIRPRIKVVDEMDARRAEELQALRAELNWLYTRLTRGAAPGESGAPAANPETWEKIQSRERAATTLWRELQARHPEALSLMRVAPLPPEEIQARLPDSAALVEFFVARGQLTAFVITSQRVSAYPAIVPLKALLPLLEQLAFQFSKFQYGPAYTLRHRAALLAATQAILEQLGQLLLGPLWGELSGLQALYIVPHGPLHALPFHALRLSEKYLIETHTVSYAPNAAVLQYCWDRPASNLRRPLLVGLSDERTQHVAQEIQALVELFPNADVLLDQAATFDRVRQQAAECGILHLATHGLFRPEAPLLSAIGLADRWMAVQDVYDLDLKAGLVMLSACETGLGHDAGGDDLVGLARGFLYAGAASIIVSLWMVDDEAMTLLVSSFYQHLLAGWPKSQALRQAQLDLLNRYPHPYFWAPLMLIGNEK